MIKNKVQIYGIVLVLLLLGTYCFSENTEPRFIDLNQFTVSGDIPTSWILAHTPYQTTKILYERKDLDESIVNRERKKTIHWMVKSINGDYFPRKNEYFVNDQVIFPISGMGERKDDACVAIWEKNGYKFEIIDYRILTALVYKKNLSIEKTIDIFKKIVNFGASPRDKILDFKEYSINNEIYYGKIYVKYSSYGWFAEPIEWYRDGDYILFAFQKILRPTWDKTGLCIDYKEDIGGIPPEDPRSFKRFENPNYEKLAKEYKDKFFTDEKLEKMFPKEWKDKDKPHHWGTGKNPVIPDK
jgi:hypothetical protein